MAHRPQAPRVFATLFGAFVIAVAGAGAATATQAPTTATAARPAATATATPRAASPATATSSSASPNTPNSTPADPLPTTQQPGEKAPPKTTVAPQNPHVVTPKTAPAAPRAATPNASGGGTPIIIDTDIFGSADDAGALAVANALQDNGKVNILGVVVNWPSQYGASAVDAIDTYYGHKIPIGAVKPSTTDVSNPDYAKYLTDTFPHPNVPDGSQVPDATALYRQLLAGAADHSVEIVAIGLETNLANLMNSPPDGSSKLNGIDLISQKVKSLAMMGGEFPDSTKDGAEFNWTADPTAANRFATGWPASVPVEFEGYEVGSTISTGAGIGNTPQNNPVRAAYEHAIGAGKSMGSWDPVNMYYVGMGLDGLFTDSGAGSVVIDPSNGSDYWTSTGNQHYLVESATPDTIASKVEALMDQLPASGGGGSGGGGGGGGGGSGDPITAKYSAMGGAGGSLGNPVGAEYAPTPSGKAQDYDHGTIYWDQAAGAHEMNGAILAHFKAIGGPARYGYPQDDESGTADGKARYNTLDASFGAAVYWTPNTGAWEIQGAILAHWNSLGGEAGVLGCPITDESATPDRAGRYNHFSNPDGASIYWSPNSGAAEIQGAIRAHWASMGWETSVLGYPTTDETGTPDKAGRYNHFSNGSVYWTPSTDAHAVYGAIHAHWSAMGWEQGPMGYPVTDETSTPDGVGRYNHFSKYGSIYWTPGTGAHGVYGAIRDRWASMGWERSQLGYPVSDEYDVSGGRRNDFVHGWITYTWSTGQIQVG